jgi:hypothetical protein
VALLKGVIPKEPMKQNVHYDMKGRPSLYMQATFKLALLTKGCSRKGMEFYGRAPFLAT